MPKSSFLARAIVTGLGTGYLRPAPGTWGSLAPALIALALLAAGAGQLAVNLALAAIVMLATVGCVALGRFAEQAFGRKDPSYCTLDEWAGQSLSLLLLPFGATLGANALAVGIGFAAFRFFDILKPPPARQLERLPHGWGVVADDLMAGVYANLACQIMLRLLLA